MHVEIPFYTQVRACVLIKYVNQCSYVIFMYVMTHVIYMNHDINYTPTPSHSLISSSPLFASFHTRLIVAPVYFIMFHCFTIYYICLFPPIFFTISTRPLFCLFWHNYVLVYPAKSLLYLYKHAYIHYHLSQVYEICTSPLTPATTYSNAFIHHITFIHTYHSFISLPLSNIASFIHTISFNLLTKVHFNLFHSHTCFPFIYTFAHLHSSPSKHSSTLFTMGVNPCPVYTWERKELHHDQYHSLLHSNILFFSHFHNICILALTHLAHPLQYFYIIPPKQSTPYLHSLLIYFIPHGQFTLNPSSNSYAHIIHLK